MLSVFLYCYYVNSEFSAPDDVRTKVLNEISTRFVFISFKVKKKNTNLITLIITS